MAIAAVLALGGTNVQALSLGRITVQSALGEPLRAEIEIPEISAEEAATLKAQIALPAAFKSAGMDYSPVLPSVRMTLQKRSDGRTYLRLSGDRLVQEPFVDLILEASWNTGRIVRDYTMLFDPPRVVPAPAAQPIATPMTAPKVAPSPRSVPLSSGPAVARPPASGTGTPSAPVVAKDTVKQVTVRAGETASNIARTNKLSNVSLDQMLVAMQQINPKAFIAGNVNRIKAGAILALPTAEQARATTPVQASQIIMAQSQDFNRFRRALASNVADVKQAPAERNISGTIQATVEDKKATAQTPDKLTLSKGAVQNASDLEQLALARNAAESASRAAQTSQNTAELEQLAKTAASMAASGAASATVAESTAPALTAAPASVAPVSAPEAQKPASAAIASPTVAIPAPASSFLDELIANPLLPAGAAALVLLLAGLGFYKVRQRQEKAAEESSFMESSLQGESFFGTSGGQNVDTLKSQTPDSSMAYTPSQLDAEEDIDPVAQADVYLAYGRDVQAEEILKDALRSHPEHLAVHEKLLAIYAKRQDAKAYAAVAALAHPLTQGTGPRWAQICRTGLVLEPGNALYLTGAQSTSQSTVPPLATLPAGSLAGQSDVVKGNPPSPASDTVVDLDLDLDFSVDAPAPVVDDLPSKMLEFDLNSLSLDLGDSNFASTELPSDASADPLESKLALAEEFKASGDDDGARELIKQVIAEADGAIKAKAQQALRQF